MEEREAHGEGMMEIHSISLNSSIQFSFFFFRSLFAIFSLSLTHFALYSFLGPKKGKEREKEMDWFDDIADAGYD